MANVWENTIKVDADGNATIDGNLTVSGATTTVSTTNTVVSDKLLELANGTSGTPSGDAGIIIERGSSTNTFIGWDESADKIVLGTTSATGASTGDLTITPTNLNVSDIALTPDGITTSHITTDGSLKIRATNNMHIGDDGVDSIRLGRVNSSAAKIHLRSGADTDLVVSDSKVGIGTETPAHTLDVVGDVDISGGLSFDAGTAVTSIDTDITSVSGSDDTLASAKAIKTYVDAQFTAQDLDFQGDSGGALNIDLDSESLTIAGGTGITTTGSSNTLTVAADAAQTGITSVVNASLEIGRDADNRIKFGTDNQIIFEVDGGDNVIFKASGEIEATSLDISGDADIDGTLEADAITVDGTALNEYIADTVGAMVGSNTETGITVSYDDADNTLDFVVDQVTSLGTITQDTVTFTSANADDPLLIIKNTTSDAAAARLRFVKDKGAAGADADGCGEIEFYGDDDNQDNILFAKVRAEVADASNGAEGGRLMLGVATHDGEFQNGLVIEDGSAEDEVNVIIGNVSTSKTSVSGALGVRDTAPKVSLNVVHDYNTATFENQLADGEGGGRVLRYSPGADDTLTVGQLYFLHTDGTWDQTNANAVATGASQMLGVGLGNARTAGLLMEGFIRIPSTEILNVPGSGAVDGLPVYVSTTVGHFDFTAPSGGGDFVRIVGHAIDDDSGDVLIYFNPSNNWVEL